MKVSGKAVRTFFFKTTAVMAFFLLAGAAIEVCACAADASYLHKKFGLSGEAAYGLSNLMMVCSIIVFLYVVIEASTAVIGLFRRGKKLD